MSSYSNSTYASDFDDDPPRKLGPEEFESEVATFGDIRLRITYFRGKLGGVEVWIPPKREGQAYGYQAWLDPKRPWIR